jgi:hypothetical protein
VSANYRKKIDILSSLHQPQMRPVYHRKVKAWLVWELIALTVGVLVYVLM